MSFLPSLSTKDTEMPQSKFPHPRDNEDRDQANCKLLENAVDLNCSI